MQSLHDIVQGWTGVAVQLALGLQELVYSLQQHLKSADQSSVRAEAESDAHGKDRRRS